MPLKAIGGTDPVLLYGRPAYHRPAKRLLIANTDLVNPIYYDDQLSITAGSSQIPPLGAVAFDGETDIYGSTLSPGTVVVADIVRGGLQWGPSPAQTAAQIAISGVPLLSKPTLVKLQPGATIPASGTATPISGQQITQTGYEIAVTLLIGSAATVPGARVTLTWSDSVSGQTVSTENWYLAAASGASPQQYTGTGPTKGDTLTLTITNLDSAVALTYSLTLTQNSRQYARDDWRQPTVFPVPGQTAASYDQPSNLLFSSNPLISSGLAVQRWIPLYAGDVTFTVINGPNANSQLSLLAFLDSALTLSNFWTSPLIAANGILNAKITLPRQSCLAFIANGTGASANIAVTGVISEQLP